LAGSAVTDADVGGPDVRSSRTVTRSLLAAAVAVTTISGCSLLGDPVQRQWAHRRQLPSCGTVELDQTTRLEDVGGDAVECLEAARTSGAGGELVLTSLTTEGDPIIEYRRVMPTGTTEVYTDATKDKFGDGRWQFGSCDRPTSAMDSDC
jgi:hypothetical protein